MEPLLNILWNLFTTIRMVSLAGPDSVHFSIVRYPMKLNGWNSWPDGYIQEIDFTRANVFVRVLARTPYFERFAYPLAIKSGCGTLWPMNSEQPSNNLRSFEGWNVESRSMSNLELQSRGAYAELTSHQQPSIWRFVHKRRKINLGKNYFISFSLWPHDSSTRLARQLATLKELNQWNGIS